MSGLEAELLELMLDRITIEPQTGTDKHNNWVYGPPVTDIPCHIERAEKRLLQTSNARTSTSVIEGRELTSQVQIILGRPELDVKISDRVTLASGEILTILGINASPDQFGPYFLEILA